MRQHLSYPLFRGLLAMLLCLRVVALPASAVASEDGAREHYEEAEKAYAIGRFEEALKHYLRSLEVRDVPALYFNIAQCHRQLKQWERALFFYRRFLSRSTDETQNAVAQKHIAAIETIVARLARERALALKRGTGNVTLFTTPAGASVWAEGTERCRTPCTLELVAGRQVLILRRPGHFDERVERQVRPFIHELVTLSLDPDLPVGRRPPIVLLEQPIGLFSCLAGSCDKAHIGQVRSSATTGGEDAGPAIGAGVLFYPRRSRFHPFHAQVGFGLHWMMEKLGSGIDSLTAHHTGLQLRFTLPITAPFLSFVHLDFQGGYTYVGRSEFSDRLHEESAHGVHYSTGVTWDLPVVAFGRLGVTARLQKTFLSEDWLESRGLFVGIVWSAAIPHNIEKRNLESVEGGR
ncbi:MAG: hypothetical protein CVU65_02005 [Deltaproteobacteria bacterium HGW-Deltaproteobacteria-22]|jgi:hypothetical protein|nr:MAG: hypothetical protein CVU65_02005 [Deltaproteobacteria bacterium HGW-Deltaproteobacteria-22]